MSWVDLVIVAVVALGGWNGYRTGLFRQITRLFGAVIAYFLALWLKPYIAPAIRGMHWFPHTPGGVIGYLLGDVSGAIAFAAVFFITFFLLRYASGLVDALFSLPVLSFFNRLAGLVVGLILAVIFVFVVGAVLRYIQSPGLQHALSQSSILQYLDAKQTSATFHQVWK